MIMKRNFLLLAVLGFVCGLTLSAQVYLPKKAYMHLVGRINDQQEITLNLVKVNDSMYADLVYNNETCTHAVLFGKVDPEDGSFWLKHPFCDTGMVFNGNFITRQSLSGNLESEDGEKQYPFVLVESYPAGSLPLLVYFKEMAIKLVEKEESPQAEIHQCLIVPGESSNPIISDSLQNMMIQSYTTVKSVPRDPGSVLASVQNQFIDNYLSSNKSLYESMPESASMNWTLLKFMHVLYNDNYLLSYYLLSYAFTGGAHGMETQEFTVINMQNGIPLTLAEIFNKGFEPDLTSVLTRKLKKMYHLSAQDRLTDHGFFVDDITPTSNFYVTGNGIGFYYNHYDIAPYSNGPTDILVPFDELKGMIKEKSPISVLK